MKKTRFLSLVLTLSVLAALFLPVSASALEEPALNCAHAVLLDANYNEVLYEKNAYEKAYPCLLYTSRRQTLARACSRSAMMSFTSSMPAHPA